MKKFKTVVALLCLVCLLVAASPLVAWADSQLSKPVISSVTNTAKGVTVEWKAVSGAAKYRVYQKGPDDAKWVKVADTKNTKYEDTKVVSGTKYQFAVRCLNSKGKLVSDFSKAKTLTYIARPTIASVTNAKAGVKIEWNKVAGATKYRVFRKGPNDSSWVKLADVSGTKYTDKTAKSGTKYSYALKSLVSGKARNVFSASKSITYIARPAISSVSSTKNGVTIKWKAVTGAEAYRVYRKGPGESSFKKLADVTAKQYIDKTAESGSKYTYKLECVNKSGKVVSAGSATKSLTYIARPAISSLEATDTGVKISWSKVEGAAKYRIFRKGPGENSFKKLTDTAKLSYVDKTAKDGEKYIYRLRSINSAGKVVNTFSATKSIVYSISAKVYVSAPRLTIYKEKSNSAEKTHIRYMAEVKLLTSFPDKNVGKWIPLEYNGKTWYYYQKPGVDMVTTEKSSFSYSTSTKYQREVVDLALSFLNKPTRYEKTHDSTLLGKPDDQGVYCFDCSGFTSYVINTVMQKYIPAYKISVDVDEQYVTGTIYNKGYSGTFSAKTIIAKGKAFDQSKLQPGDLIFFKQINKDDTTRTVDHVGIYLGKGEYIHSVHEFAVNVSCMKDFNLEDFIAAIRVLPGSENPIGATMYTVKSTKLYAEMTLSTVVETIEAGQAVTLQYTNKDGSLAYVEHGTKKGFVKIENLSEEDPFSSETRYVAAASVKLYVNRGGSGESVSVRIGTKLDYQGQYGTSQNYKVIYNSKEYYIWIPSGRSIDEVLSSNKDIATTVQKTVKCTAGCSVYAEPLSTATKTGSLKVGDSVGVVAYSFSDSTWAYVKLSDGSYGYVYSKNLG